MLKYGVILFEGSKQLGTYRLEENLFIEIKNKIEPFRSLPAQSKNIRCIELGRVFKNAKEANKWLVDEGIINHYHAEPLIKAVCKGKREQAYGYHWEFVKEELNKLRAELDKRMQL